MPAVSRVQRKLMGADYARAKEGKPTRTGMSMKQLRDFASTPESDLPKRAKQRKDMHARRKSSSS